MTAQTLYNQLVQGIISEEKFLYEVRRDPRLPMITKFNSLKDTIQILKSKSIITENKDLVPKYKADKNPKLPEIESFTIDQVSPYEYGKGINYELELTQLAVGQNMPTEEEMVSTQRKVLKNLTSDPYYYTKKCYSDAEKKTEKENLRPEELKKDFTAPNQLKKLKEIKVNTPNKIWKLNKYIPDFDPSKVQIGDRILGVRLGKPYDVKIENIEDGYEGDILFTFNNNQQAGGKQLISQNKKLKEIKVNNPLKFQNFKNLISQENEDEDVLSINSWDDLVDYMIDMEIWEEDDVPEMYKLMNSLKEDLEGEECSDCERAPELDLDELTPQQRKIVGQIVEDWGLTEHDLEDDDVLDEIATELNKITSGKYGMEEAVVVKDKAGNVQYAKDDNEAAGIINNARTKGVQLTKSRV